MEKIVYQTDEQGFFVSPCTADPSPLEPGTYLIPGGCVESPPPAIPNGHRARWTNETWVMEAAPESSVAPITPSPTESELFEMLRARRTARLTACDWTQLPDAPLAVAQVEAWRLYRQALRDLPEVTADPADPVWPVSP